MCATVRLAVASVRKAKGQMLTLAGFAALAAMMVNLGLVLAVVYPSAFDTQAAKAKVPDLWSVSTHHFDGVYQTVLDEHPSVVAVEQEPGAWLTGAVTHQDGTDETFPLFFEAYGSPRSMDLPLLRDGAAPLSSDGVYLPYFLYTIFGYSVGDTFTFQHQGTAVDLTVCGFTYDLVAGRLYVDDSTLTRLTDQFPRSSVVHTKIRLDDPSKADIVRSALVEAYFDHKVTDPTALSVVATADSVKWARLFMGQVLAAILLGAAATIGLVALVVVRFRVKASVEESMTNIGILKTMGYTSGQVAGSLIGQFCLAVALGSVVGVCGGAALLPLTADLLEQESAIAWIPGLEPVSALVTIAAVTGAALVVTAVAAARIRRLPPL
ncbi:MAG: ABC transporter permease, partial [Micrococcales bacterium]|nr:ABC transporter permease [Micrococcales bacterium]